MRGFPREGLLHWDGIKSAEAILAGMEINHWRVIRFSLDRLEMNLLR